MLELLRKWILSVFFPKNDEQIRRILDAGSHETTEQAATRLVDEVIAYRSGLAAGFGIYTANPHNTLVELANSHRDHHEEHHRREKEAKAILDAGATPLQLIKASQLIAVFEDYYDHE